MEKKSELLKQEPSKILIIKEQQFYEDVRLILQRAREEAWYHDICLLECGTTNCRAGTIW